ncbi:hypothetical protein DSO57_1031546 [Entomophthora muscae]|uniref:Uncharacterized protein n=1 Tax=Entomophthora muscae TaxID=34485 RepID=A0ACC2SDZ7_9FUNG|nr:hypothetical protein DSO57_1031546 [Entomophthora muscae]
MDMEPPVSPKPMPASAPKIPLDHTNKLFGIVYITLTGLIDTIVPAASLWSWVGNTNPLVGSSHTVCTCQFPNTSELANQGWFPDNREKGLFQDTEAFFNILEVGQFSNAT